MLLSISEKEISSRRKNHLFPASKFSNFSYMDHPTASSSLLGHGWLLTTQQTQSLPGQAASRYYFLIRRVHLTNPRFLPSGMSLRCLILIKIKLSTRSKRERKQSTYSPQDGASKKQSPDPHTQRHNKSTRYYRVLRIHRLGRWKGGSAFKALAALPGNPSSIPNTHMEAHNHA